MKRIKPGRKIGYKMSAESKKRIAESKIGIPRTQETKDRISVGMKEMWYRLKTLADSVETSNKTIEEIIRELNDKEKQ